MNKKCVLICSGGMDSVTLLYDLFFQNYDIKVLSFNYGSKHNNKEIFYAKYHCEKLKIFHKEIYLNLEDLGFKSNLLKGGQKIPEGHYAADNMASTVVSYRNGIMLSIAAGFADSNKINKVFLGSHMGDRAQYKDCTKEFTQAINLSTILGTDSKVEIISPYNDMMKWDILKKGLELNVDYSKTHSCYNGAEPPCSKCGTCVERTESFVRNNAQDPKYPDEKSWKNAIQYMKKTLKSFDEKN